jgi:cyclomaltodextrinase
LLPEEATHSMEKLIGKLGRGTLTALLLVLLSGSMTSDARGQSIPPPPKWLQDGVVYEVFPRQFSSTGDFKGVTARLDELKNLGVTIIWLMPIHPIGEKLRKGTYGSPYSTRDYYAVNPDYGTKADLKHLIGEAHRRGMKVILDMVLLHTAWDNRLMKRPEFYKHDSQGRIVPPMPEWTDVAGLNYENPELRHYMIDMLRHWVTETDVDGFRCDTASMVPTRFWEEASAALKQTKPDLMLLAEADKPELLQKAFDIDYAWPLLNTMHKVLGEGAPALELQRTWEADRKRYAPQALRLNMSDNHDQARAVARFGIRGALAASAFLFTLDGVPMLYNGMEVGDATESGDRSLFERVPIVWFPKDRPPLRDIYRDLIRLRRTHSALRTGRVDWLSNSAPENLVSFLRSDEHDQFLIVVNFSNRPISGDVSLERPAAFSMVNVDGFKASRPSVLPKIQLNGFEWRIYRAAGVTVASQAPPQR